MNKKFWDLKIEIVSLPNSLVIKIECGDVARVTSAVQLALHVLDAGNLASFARYFYDLFRLEIIGHTVAC